MTKSSCYEALSSGSKHETCRISKESEWEIVTGPWGKEHSSSGKDNPMCSVDQKEEQIIPTAGPTGPADSKKVPAQRPTAACKSLSSVPEGSVGQRDIQESAVKFLGYLVRGTYSLPLDQVALLL